MADSNGRRPRPVTLFLCGDVMTGRGIDQILPHPSRPHLYEPYVRSAIDYVRLAEHAAGSIERPADLAYVWGEALSELDRVRPDARIVNLETAVTASETPWPRKGIHYRMHPANVGCLASARLDCCCLANNHVLDWGREGLEETLGVLHAAGLRTAGAGRSQTEAAAPAIIDLPGESRVLVFALAREDSGVPGDWAATSDVPGVHLLADYSRQSVDGIAKLVRAHRGKRDIVVLSIHWGGNWGYEVAPDSRAFAREVIDVAGVDLLHGHSSHHVKGMEVYRDRPIIYGCGDFLNDYEGIEGNESFRSDLSLMYFPTLDAESGRLLHFAMTPTRIRRLSVERAPRADAEWLAEMLNREGRELGTRVSVHEDCTLALSWGDAR